MRNRPWVPWVAAAWTLAASLWFFTRDLPDPAGTRASVAGGMLLVPEQFLEGDEELPSSFGGVFHPWRWKAWGTAAAVWAAAWLLGEIAFANLRFRRASTAERTGFKFGLGSAWISLLTFIAGVYGGGRFLSGVVFGLGIGVPFFMLLRSELPGRFWGKLHPSYWLHLPQNTQPFWIAALAVAPFLLLIALGSTVPTTEFDAREYHLQGPKEWFEAGEIERLPHNVYTQMPAGTEMLTLLCMHLCGDWRIGALAGQATLAGFVPLAALAAGCVARRLFGRGCGWFAAAAFLTSPWAVRLTLHPYAEGALCAYAALTLLAVTIAVRRRRQRSWRPALLAGLLAGAAFGCKYPALLLIAAPAATALIVADRRWTKLATFAGGFALFAGPWLLKNLIETGNPVFPLLWNLFGGSGWDAATNARWVSAHAPPDWSPARWPLWLGQPLGLDTYHTSLVIAFAPLAGFIRSGRAAWLAAALGGLVVVWYLLTHRIDRFWAPLLPAGCVLAGAGLRWATTREDRPVRVTAWAAAGGGALFNLALCVGGAAGQVPFASDPEVASIVIEHRSAPLIAALNERFGPEDTVILIGEAQVFGAEFTPIYATVWNEAPLADPNAALPQNVTAVAVNWAEIARYRDSYGFDRRVTPGFLEERVAAGELRPGESLIAGDLVLGELFLIPSE
ncbi:glycosyltransferase family 39 protein [Alienimonas chondri]|uniref:glycosyltransferase family 39 protein n=1 Tax=Alienimonas chondri TaxID=2681879 RepID=UPI0014892088|nr:glycosyltransferase family 39 protein [Alienimonas chondri]